MRAVMREQNLGFRLWTPVTCEDWLTACAPVSSDHKMLEMFEWPPTGGDEAFLDDDEERGQWADAARRSLASWVEQNPF